MQTAASQRARRKAPPRFEQFFAIRRFQPTLAFTPDGRRLLFSSDLSGQFNLWRVRATGGWPEQLTTFDDQSVRQVSISPDGRTIVFTADREGDEFHQIYALPAQGGWPEAWTELPEVQHYADQRGWSPDGSVFAYAANSETPTDQEVWLRDVASGEVRKAFGGDVVADPAGWSPDGSRLLVVESRSNSDTTIHLVEDADSSELTPHEGEIQFFPGPWARDGSGFYLRTDEGREFLGLAFFDLERGSYDWLETPEGDVEEVALSQDGRVLAWTVNEAGWGRLRLRDLETGELLPEPQQPPGVGVFWGQSCLCLSPDGSRAALLWASPRRAHELYVVDTRSGRARKVTDNMVGGLRERQLAAPELVHVPTWDGREIAAWLYRPRTRRRAAAVLAVHGGPEAQERPWYQPFYQYLVSRGFVVLAPNIRGSTGYGKTYQRLIHRDWGGGDLRDFEALARWLQDQDFVDERRLGVYGGSYGGFATLTCVTRLPEYWAAAVDIVGPSNLVTFSKAVPPTWRRFMDAWVGNPDTEADFLLERSPITYVDQVRAPLLVMQGAHDPRVVKPESDQMVDRLRELGREVEYVVFEDEGHGFTKRSNQLRSYRLAVDWFERHLSR
ncbi:MAG TPA: S9 family peptidase [Gaiellaceae bacterium]|nr:S9 family peptidase [Gaiellaceae bacterium]